MNKSIDLDDITILRKTRLFSLSAYIISAMQSKDINEMATFDQMWPTIKKDLEQSVKMMWKDLGLNVK